MLGYDLKFKTLEVNIEFLFQQFCYFSSFLLKTMQHIVCNTCCQDLPKLPEVYKLVKVTSYVVHVQV